TLVSLGSGIAFAWSVAVVALLPDRMTFFDVSALVVTLIAVGKYLEISARGRAGEAIEALAGLQPSIAHLLRRAGSPAEADAAEPGTSPPRSCGRTTWCSSGPASACPPTAWCSAAPARSTNRC